LPNRVIRDGILTSEKVDQLSESEELFYRRLMSVVDDLGRYSANPKLLLSGCYPLRCTTMTIKTVSGYLEACRAAGLVDVYEVAGKKYVELADFRQRTRLMMSKWPDRDGHMTVIRQSNDGQNGVNGQSHDGENPIRIQSEVRNQTKESS